jgi:hypothetical protein
VAVCGYFHFQLRLNELKITFFMIRKWRVYGRLC